jgi:SAM-dependent methyltransferase
MSLWISTAWEAGKSPPRPTLRTLVLRRGRRGLQLMAQGRLRTALHLAVATAADLWNFCVWPAEAGAECPCCGWRGPAFLASWDWRAPTFQSRCPQCDSRSRHRGLEPLLPRVLREKPEGPVLVFGPETVTLDQLHRLAPGETVAGAEAREIESLPQKDGSLALIICNHVLPLVPDDRRAVEECARMLRPGGIAVFTAPGNFRVECSWYFPHTVDGNGFRRYGMDLMSRLQASFRRVEAVDLGQQARPAWRVRPGDYAFVCVR